MVHKPGPFGKPFIRYFIEKASEHGFTRGDILWVLRETMLECHKDERKPGLRLGLYLEILKEKVAMMVEARRIVKDVCEELGIKAEGL